MVGLAAPLLLGNRCRRGLLLSLLLPLLLLLSLLLQLLRLLSRRLPPLSLLELSLLPLSVRLPSRPMSRWPTLRLAATGRN